MVDSGPYWLTMVDNYWLIMHDHVSYWLTMMAGDNGSGKLISPGCASLSDQPQTNWSNKSLNQPNQPTNGPTNQLTDRSTYNSSPNQSRNQSTKPNHKMFKHKQAAYPASQMNQTNPTNPTKQSTKLDPHGTCHSSTQLAAPQSTASAMVPLRADSAPATGDG